MTQIHNFSTADQNIFFTSDTHFWHDNIIKYCNRPFASSEEMNETIIKNWNAVVKPNDIVFHLGDFCFCSAEKFNEIFDRLNGRIYLIIGNHDWKNLKAGMFKKFEGVYQQMAIRINKRHIYLNHFPFLCYSGSWRGVDATWQLFGHVHSSAANAGGLDNQRLVNLFPTQYDVGVDNNNYTPVSFEQVSKIIETQMMSLNMHRGE